MMNEMSLADGMEFRFVGMVGVEIRLLLIAQKQDHEILSGTVVGWFSRLTIAGKLETQNK